MTARSVTIEPTWDAFRDVARQLISERVHPAGVEWSEEGEESTRQLGLLEPELARQPVRGPTPKANARVPKAFVDLAEAVACHRAPSAWPWLYRVLWRVTRGERNLLGDPADADMVVLGGMERAVRRDSHKMKAFVRFRTVSDPEGERFVAWFEPKHRIVRRTAPFFERRFPSMRWSILTPDECAHWDGDALSFTPGLTREAAPAEDALEEAWLTYYTHTFNPARVRVQAMRAEMPVYYWRNMPEAMAIAGLLRDAPARVRKMLERAGEAGVAGLSEGRVSKGGGTVARGGSSSRVGVANRDVLSGSGVIGVGEATAEGGGEDRRPDATASDNRAQGGEVRRRGRGADVSPTSHDHDPARRVGEPAPEGVLPGIWAGSSALFPQTGDGRSGYSSLESDSRRKAVREPPTDLAPLRIPGVRIGVAGWDYPDWAGRVYPAGRDGVDRLRWVASRFDLIEVNSTFYRPASRRAVTSWLERTDDLPHLQFAAKLVRAFTHERGAWRDSDVAAVREGMLPLLEAGKLNSLLIQFPWSFKLGYEERRHLKRVFDAFADFPLHVEVRHASWNHVGFKDYLTGRGIGLVNIDQPLFDNSIEPAEEVTSSIAYLRLHGRNKEAWFRSDATRDERYDYSYSREELAPWVERTRRLLQRSDVEEVDVVFNNHYRGQAVDNAEEFARLLKRGSAEEAA